MSSRIIASSPLYIEWSKPGPPWSRTTVGRSTIVAPSGISATPPTSTNSRRPGSISTRIGGRIHRTLTDSPTALPTGLDDPLTRKPRCPDALMKGSADTVQGPAMLAVSYIRQGRPAVQGCSVDSTRRGRRGGARCRGRLPLRPRARRGRGPLRGHELRRKGPRGQDPPRSACSSGTPVRRPSTTTSPAAGSASHCRMTAAVRHLAPCPTTFASLVP